MKKALVTGADGFIGSHLVEALLERGYKVRALAQYNSFNDWGWLEGVGKNPNLEIVSGDIRDSFQVDDLCQGVDVIFHLAALIAIPYSYVAPSSYIDTNIQGTVNICKAAMRHKVARVIHTSTSEVYGTAKYVPINEEHPLQPQSPYSASKIAADAMAQSFFNSFGLPLTIARPFNTYGPRQSARAIIPTIITQILAGAKELRVGDMSPTRDFNYVSDTVRAFIMLSESERAVGEIVNIGSNYEISVRDTLNLIKEIIGRDVAFVVERERLRPERSEVRRLWCDNTKIKALVNFEPQVKIREGLKHTVNWFSENGNLKKYKSDIYNI